MEEFSRQQFDYRAQSKEDIPCNLCGAADFFALARRSKNNLPVTTRLCKRCGLVYISPRMSKEGYDAYYRDFYRRDRSVIKGKQESDEGMNFESARRFGQALGALFGPYIRPGLAIDVGSSTGGILFGLRESVAGIEALGIEPSRAESEYANARGVKTIAALFEDARRQSFPPASTIFCVQTFNHLLDPRGFLRWAFAQLIEGGHLILAVKNFRHQVRRAGFLEAGVQIDHPFMFTPETLKLFVISAGFTLVHGDVDEGKSRSALRRQRQRGLSAHHIRLVARKDSAVARSAAAPEISRLAYGRLRFTYWRPWVKMIYFFYYRRRGVGIKKWMKR